MKHVGDMRVQVDRWPLNGSDDAPHILSVIVVALYPKKPSKADIINALQTTAADMLRATTGAR